MTIDQRAELLQSLKGQQARLPDLRPIFAGWPGVHIENINPHWKAMTVVVDDKLRSLFKDEAKLARLKAADFALFAASWWPHTGFEELRILTFMSIWLFTWDDEIDEPTGSCADDFEAAQQYRVETVGFVEQCLGLRTSDVTLVPKNAIIESFRVIGEQFLDVYTLEQRKRYFGEISRFLEGSQLEQEIRLSGKIPSVAEYWGFRVGTSAVGVGIAALEYANKVRLSNSMMKDADMKAIWEETNIIISITNDLLSLKKEIALGCIDSIVPLTCANGVSVQCAIDAAVKSLQLSRSRFDMAADRFLSRARKSWITDTHLEDWIEGCRHNCVGNLTWRSASSLFPDPYFSLS